MNRSNARDNGDDDDCGDLPWDHKVPIGDHDHHACKYCDGKYYDDARTRNRDDDKRCPNIAAGKDLVPLLNY